MNLKQPIFAQKYPKDFHAPPQKKSICRITKKLLRAKSPPFYNKTKLLESGRKIDFFVAQNKKGKFFHCKEQPLPQPPQIYPARKNNAFTPRVGGALKTRKKMRKIFYKKAQASQSKVDSTQILKSFPPRRKTKKIRLHSK